MGLSSVVIIINIRSIYVNYNYIQNNYLLHWFENEIDTVDALLPPIDSKFYWPVRDTCSLPQVTGMPRCSFVDAMSMEFHDILRLPS